MWKSTMMQTLLKVLAQLYPYVISWARLIQSDILLAFMKVVCDFAIKLGKIVVILFANILDTNL